MTEITKADQKIRISKSRLDRSRIEKSISGGGRIGFWGHFFKEKSIINFSKVSSLGGKNVCFFWDTPYAIFSLKSSFFGFCEATESQNGTPTQIFFANTFRCFWCGPFFFFGHPAPTTHISGNRNFCIWPFLGENRHFGGIFALNDPISGLKSKKKLFGENFL